MVKGRRSFGRRAPDRHYRTRFVVATEGQETEPQYFSMFNSKNSTIHVILLKSTRKTSPGQVLDRLKKADIEVTLEKKNGPAKADPNQRSLW